MNIFGGSKVSGGWRGPSAAMARLVGRGCAAVWLAALASGGAQETHPAPPAVAAQAQADAPAAPAAKAEAPKGWFSDWTKLKREVEKNAGTSVVVYMESTHHMIFEGEHEDASRSVFWWKLRLTQDLWPDAKLIVDGRGSTGEGLDPLLHDWAAVNWMAYEPTISYLADVYLEQKFFDKRLTVAVGKYTQLIEYFDDNTVGSWNFLAYSLARNPQIPLTYHVASATIRYEPWEWLYVQAGVADALGRADGAAVDTAFRESEPYAVLAEAGVRPKIGKRQGNYRVLFWHDARDRERIDGDGMRNSDAGVGLNFDQQITDQLGLFFRFGWQDPAVRATEFFWSFGGKWAGPIPARRQDALFAGVCQNILGEDYQRENDSTRAETLLEIYYSVALTDWLWLVPDVQVIVDPAASRQAHTTVIGALRCQVLF